MTSSSVPPYWQEASRELAAGDQVMAGFVARYSGDSLISRGDPFGTLVRSIVGQQISVKAADSIWARFSGALPAIEPESILATTPEALRACGLSARKVEYISDLARHFSDGQIHVDRWNAMGDADEVGESLSREFSRVWLNISRVSAAVLTVLAILLAAPMIISLAHAAQNIAVRLDPAGAAPGPPPQPAGWNRATRLWRSPG